jgi:hypothetical protein
MHARREAYGELIAAETPTERRRELLERYAIRHFVLEADRLRQRVVAGYGPMIVGVHNQGPLFVIEVDPERRQQQP